MCSDSYRLLSTTCQRWMNFGLWAMFRIILYKSRFDVRVTPRTGEGPLTSQRCIQMKVCSTGWSLLLFGPSSIRWRCVEVSRSFLGPQMKLHNSWKVLFSGGVEKLIAAPSAWSYFKTCSIRAEWYKHSAASSVTHVFICTLSTLNCSGGNMWEQKCSRTLFKAPDLWNKRNEVSSAGLPEFTVDWKTFSMKYTHSAQNALKLTEGVNKNHAHTVGGGGGLCFTLQHINHQ